MPATYSAGPSHDGHCQSAALAMAGPSMEFENAFQRISSLDQKPDRPGKPAMAQQEMRKVQRVSGMKCRMPPMLRMSCDASVSWMRACMAWITEPAPRNRQALKKACVKTWKKPAA